MDIFMYTNPYTHTSVGTAMAAEIFDELSVACPDLYGWAKINRAAQLMMNELGMPAVVSRQYAYYFQQAGSGEEWLKNRWKL